jgi:hypothetical protein
MKYRIRTEVDVDDSVAEPEFLVHTLVEEANAVIAADKNVTVVGYELDVQKTQWSAIKEGGSS